MKRSLSIPLGIAKAGADKLPSHKNRLDHRSYSPTHLPFFRASRNPFLGSIAIAFNIEHSLTPDSEICSEIRITKSACGDLNEYTINNSPCTLPISFISDSSRVLPCLGKDQVGIFIGPAIGELGLAWHVSAIAVSAIPTDLAYYPDGRSTFSSGRYHPTQGTIADSIMIALMIIAIWIQLQTLDQ